MLGNHAWDRKSGEREAATREKRQKARKRIVPAHDTTRLKETVSEGKGGRRREKFSHNNFLNSISGGAQGGKRNKAQRKNYVNAKAVELQDGKRKEKEHATAILST